MTRSEGIDMPGLLWPSHLGRTRGPATHRIPSLYRFSLRFRVRMVALTLVLGTLIVLCLAPSALAAAPEISEVQVFGISRDEATFEATINPMGGGTTYHYELVTEQEFRNSGYATATKIPSAIAGLGDGNAPVAVRQEASGLLAQTAYRLRLIGTNADGVSVSEERIFVTQPTPLGGLANGRAYEQATPVDKAGLNANSLYDAVQAAPDGNAITYYAEAGLPQSEGAQDFGIFQARRGAEDWTALGLLPPASLGSQGRVVGLSEDGLYSYVTVKRPGSANPPMFYSRNNSTRSLQLIGQVSGTPGVLASSADNTLVAFETTAALVPGAIIGRQNVYVWSRDTGEIRLASTLNDGSPPTEEGSFGGAINWWTNAPSTTQGGATSGYYTQHQHVMSADGSRLFFTSGREEEEAGEVQIYMRENPAATQSALDGEGSCIETAKACTKEISAPNAGVVDPLGSRPAIFLGADPSGSLVYFMSSGKLTSDATTGPTDEGTDLYRYDANAPEGQHLVDLSVDVNPTDTSGADVKGLLGYSAEGGEVYFAAAGAIPGSGAPESTCEGHNILLTGLCNIYMWRPGDASPSWVAQLDMGTLEEANRPDIYSLSASSRGNSGGPSVPTARVSPQDGVLVFTSVHPITGYDNEGPLCREVNSLSGGLPGGGPGRCPEIFRYEPGASGPICISCRPDGAQPLGLGASLNSGGLEPVSKPSARPVLLSRAISADGSRVFFTTSDPLVAADVNGNAGCPVVNDFGTGAAQGRCQDVYEWEAPGSNECPSTASESACVHLISSGTSPEPSFFADNDESGSNVFFFTAEELVGQDKDNLLDVYDARVGGGLPLQNASAPEPCVGEVCKGPATPPPSASAPGSTGFRGPENPTPGKGKHKKKHKHHRSKHHKKNHNQRGKHKKPKGVKRRGPQQRSNAGRNVQRPAAGTGRQGGR